MTGFYITRGEGWEGLASTVPAEYAGEPGGRPGVYGEGGDRSAGGAVSEAVMERRRSAGIWWPIAGVLAVGAGAQIMAAEGVGEAEALRRMFDLLEAPWQRKPTDEELDRAAAGIRAVADRAIDSLRRAYDEREQEFAFRHRAVQILERLATPKARTFLLDIALGKTQGDIASQREWASRAYVETLKDKAEARALLPSGDPGVLGNALRALKGQRIDARILKRLVELMAMKFDEPMAQMGLRWNVADVLASDPGEAFRKEKIEAILRALDEVERMPHAGQIYWPGSLTYAEACHHRYMQCLGRIAGTDPSLWEYAKKAAPLARDLLVLAMAGRDDPRVREEIHRILRDKGAGIRRAWVADALRTIGKPEDLPILRTLADSDPLERERGGCVPVPGEKNTYFPVREAARSAIREIEKRDVR